MAEVTAALRKAGLADVRDSVLQRALYSSDASLYRVVPAVVAHPRDDAEVAAVTVCRVLGVPLTCQGAGTSIAGNAIGTGVVLDFRTYMNRVLDIDPQAHTARVQPGVVQDQLQRAVAGSGLRFGPDPSTRNRCTIGGMIGNNACGSRSLEYGRTSENVLALTVLTAAGSTLRLTGHDDAEFTALHQIVGGRLATIRTELGRFPRQVSGYALEHLLPERGFDVRRAIVGSEGTLAVVTEGTVRLVREPAGRVLAVLGYPDMASAADAVPAIVQWRPATCEGLDSRILDVVRARRGPAGAGASARVGLAVRRGHGGQRGHGDRPGAAGGGSAGALGAMVVTDPRQAAALWRIREGCSPPPGRVRWPGRCGRSPKC